MKFLCDVHISYKVVRFLSDSGSESTHVNNILDKWKTKDRDICRYADANDLIVITKDADFRNSFYIQQTPKKLLKINLGNISNHKLIEILEDNLYLIQKLNSSSPRFLIEIESDQVIVVKD